MIIQKMKKQQTLNEQLWQAVNEYTRQVAELLECDYRDCHWVGTDDEGRGTFTICDFGDTTFLTLDQMQTIIDRLPEWEKRYGSRRAVAEEVYEWLEWSLEEQNLTNGHPRINIEHWLMGCPRERLGIGHEFDSISDTEAFQKFKKMMEDEQ